MKIAKANDNAAKNSGEDPYQWWFAKESIDLHDVNYQISVSPALKEELKAAIRENTPLYREPTFQIRHIKLKRQLLYHLTSIEIRSADPKLVYNF